MKIPEWRRLSDQSFRQTILEAAFKRALDYCKARGRNAGYAVVVLQTNSDRYSVLIAWTSATDRSWHVTHDSVSSHAGELDAREQERLRREAQQREREEARKRAEEARANELRVAAEAREKERQKALQQCGVNAVISGGPWFSSTYAVAARDEVQRALTDFVCVKEVEYVSAAPNPFGGSAARARFTGFNRVDFKPLVQIRDFAY